MGGIGESRATWNKIQDARGTVSLRRGVRDRGAGGCPKAVRAPARKIYKLRYLAYRTDVTYQRAGSITSRAHGMPSWYGTHTPHAARRYTLYTYAIHTYFNAEAHGRRTADAL